MSGWFDVSVSLSEGVSRGVESHCKRYYVLWHRFRISRMLITLTPPFGCPYFFFMRTIFWE